MPVGKKAAGRKSAYDASDLEQWIEQSIAGLAPAGDHLRQSARAPEAVDILDDEEKRLLPQFHSWKLLGNFLCCAPGLERDDNPLGWPRSTKRSTRLP